MHCVYVWECTVYVWECTLCMCENVLCVCMRICCVYAWDCGVCMHDSALCAFNALFRFIFQLKLYLPYVRHFHRKRFTVVALFTLLSFPQWLSANTAWLQEIDTKSNKELVHSEQVWTISTFMNSIKTYIHWNTYKYMYTVHTCFSRSIFHFMFTDYG